MKGTSQIPQSISIRKLARAVWRESQGDNVLGLAGQMSYFFSLALFPFLIFLAALAGTLPVTELWMKILRWMIVSLPQESQQFILVTVTGLTRGHKGFLSLGMLGTIWAASAGIMSLMSALDIIYEVKESRSFVLRLSMAILMVVVLAFFLVISFALLSFGDWADWWLAQRIGPALLWLWQTGRWIFSLVLLAIAVAFINFVLPNTRRHVIWITPGSVFVGLAWIGATTTFNLYVRYIAAYDKMYGALGAFVILMVWIYVISLITLIGAQINAQIWNMHSASSAARPVTLDSPDAPEATLKNGNG
ncbi:MAG: YihY/virulence factor BrkB family protein [Acidobacteria bacterium]|nr:YihY/virulence factor BrkB family protein [Acidobacteriota bacterium]